MKKFSKNVLNVGRYNYAPMYGERLDLVPQGV
jgi:hypothetical protein